MGFKVQTRAQNTRAPAYFGPSSDPWIPQYLIFAANGRHESDRHGDAQQQYFLLFILGDLHHTHTGLTIGRGLGGDSRVLARALGDKQGTATVLSAELRDGAELLGRGSG